MAFNDQAPGYELLAIHGRSRVGMSRFQGLAPPSPLALREDCPLKRQYADVVMVLDASTSMGDQHIRACRTKLATALEAARAFVGPMSLPGELDMAELRAMATRPEYFAWAPGAEQLVAIYRRDG